MATRTERVRVRSSDTAVSTRVHAPSALPVDDSATRQAAALAQALGVAGQAFAEVSDRRHKKAVLIGTQAALEGRDLTPEERERDSIVLGYESIRTEREIVELRHKAAALYQNSANKLNPVALQGELDALWTSEFGGLDPEVDLDRAKFRMARSAWGAIVEEINNTAATEAAQIRQDALENDLTILARDEYENTGRIDWHAFHDKIMKDGRVPGARANEIMAATARELAEVGADPELIDSIPDNWSDGTASFKTIPRFVESLGSSRRAAENQRRYNEERAQREAAAALKAQQASNGASVVANIIGGKSQKETVRQLVSAGGLTFEDAMSLVRFEESEAGLGGSGSENGWVNYGLVTAFRVGLRQGNLVMSDVIQNLDQLGGGKDGAAAISSLLELAEQSQDSRLQTPDAKNTRAILAAQYNPLQSDLDLDLDGTQHRAEKERQALALATLDSYIIGGLEPAIAAQKVREEVPPLDAPETTRRLTIAEIDKQLADGLIDQTRANELYNLATE